MSCVRCAPPPECVPAHPYRRHARLKAGVNCPNKCDSLTLVYLTVTHCATKCHCFISKGDDPRRCGSFKVLPLNAQPLFCIRLPHFFPNEMSTSTTFFHPHHLPPPPSPLPNSHPDAFPTDALDSVLLLSKRHRSLSLHPVKCQLIGALGW